MKHHVGQLDPAFDLVRRVFGQELDSSAPLPDHAAQLLAS